MKVEIWSDVVCPWCYIGKRRFETALAAFQHGSHVEVEWRSFELDRHAVSASRHEPARPTGYVERLAEKYATTRAEAQGMLDSMTAAAAQEGLDLRFDRAVRANTFDAHQLIKLGHRHGLQDVVQERLLRAYFTEGEAVGDREVLVRLAAEAGLSADEGAAVLESQRYADAVRAEEQEATALGIRGVPFFVIERTYGLSGAQPAEQILTALQRAWSDSRPVHLLTGDDGDASCGPGGCATENA